MPLSANRKVDRRALPRPHRATNSEHSLTPRNEIETRLVSIWQEVLGTEQVGVRDNFFELGGNSLLAVRLLSLIQEEFKQSLPLMALFQEGTVEAIAGKLHEEEKPVLPQGIVPIKPEGAGLPLFIVTAGLYYHELIRSLSPGRPVYGLEPFENDVRVQRQSVQETARVYYQNLVDFYPEGPYLILGHSAHGYFALELARWLVQNGKEVAFLGLIDSLPPGPARQASLPDRVKIHIDNLQDKNWEEIRQYFQDAVMRFRARRRNKSEMNPATIKIYDEQGRAGEVRKLILGSYRPEPYEGKVILFSASQRHWYIRWEPMEAWKKYLIGQVEIVPIPGDHMSAFEAPHATLLAEKIQKWLPAL